MIAVNTVNELEIAFQEVFRREDILKLYEPQDSYFWRNRWDITQIIGVLKSKERSENKLIARFEEYISSKYKDSDKKSQPGTRSATEDSNRP
jgi:hypothetical protein